ncbi:hypothetical protein HPP92_026820 [Vanilla planifolia]|uniref:Uncharacterized protein n=1 Tax=Vanilla planifolia TaxID=51239 RepID=A0A835PFD2_VANPL|nr:hypothetical protein HPP92_026820 [Vanilla planifolia]
MESEIKKNLETSLLSSADVAHNPKGKVTNHSDHEDSPKVHCGPEEIRCILEVIASSGKFWHDWEMLKNFISFQMKQVLAQYPEAVLASGIELQQISGETYPELVKRLDEALLGFTEGPPFTLQRICEILLNPKSTYRSLSKLALALEKNLLVTSTLSRCTDPYPAPQAEGSAEQSEATHYGAVNKNDNEDEEMVDAEADEDIESKGLDGKEEKEADVSTADMARNSVSNPASQAP